MKKNTRKRNYIVKLKINVFLQRKIEVLCIVYVIEKSNPKKILVSFYNGFNYSYHLIIKEWAEEFKNQYTCLGEYTEKYITFTVPIEKEVTEIGEKGEKITKKISSYDNLLVVQVLWQAHYQILSINFLKEPIILNEDMDHDDRKCKLCEIADEVYNCFLKCTNAKDDLIEYKYLIKVWLIIKRKRL